MARLALRLISYMTFSICPKHRKALSTLNEPFKVGDTIEGVTAGSLATILAVTDEGDLWARSSVLPVPFTISASQTLNWRIHVPEPERKRWAFQTERRVPLADELFVQGSRLRSRDFSVLYTEADVLVAGSVKSLPEEKP